MTVEKKMYRVEKFLPPECPKCRRKFLKESEDWTRLLGDIVNGEKQIRETNGYVIIICSGCRNYTAQMPLEAYQLSSLEKAESLIKNEGFVNLLTFTAVGNQNVQDTHIIYGTMPGVDVKSISCETDDDIKKNEIESALEKMRKWRLTNEEIEELLK